MNGGGREMRTLLIANRGEIAVRIMRTARRMGLRTVAVYADDDRHAMHVQSADVAVRLPGGTVAETYLNVAAVIAAAKATGADAIHPGYGFLAENAALAEACAEAGIIFVGPPAAAILALGDKAAARRLAIANGIPVVPGYDGSDQSLAALAAAAGSIGYPLLLKPAGGGGGKGMRVVEGEADLAGAREAAMREARRAFGDERLILEKYVAAPRHVEVQILADAHGNAVHLFDRDCSVQRRYQKLIEEAPAPNIAPEIRRRLHAAAAKCVGAAGYIGAGTVEFLLADDQFFFMEMNTRLQVEHPVTEAVTGIDLVEWQLRIARGEPLPLTQEGITANGHAIEARLLAEDPRQNFLPQAGVIRRLRLPEGMPGIRIDSGVREGDAVSARYDSLIAKIIAAGSDRGEALARLKGALAETLVGGIETNRAFLSAVLSHAAFAGRIDTGFIARHGEALLRQARPDIHVWALATLVAMRQQEAKWAGAGADPHAPWRTTTGWRLFGRATTTLSLVFGNEQTDLAVTYADGGYNVAIGDATLHVWGTVAPDGSVAAVIRQGEREMTIHGLADATDDRVTLSIEGAEYAFRVIDRRRPTAAGTAQESQRLTSPMPGQVVAVNTAAGKTVAQGEPLVVVEAMKMEHTIAAPRSGRVKAVNVAVGDRVAAGVELVALEDEA